MQFYSNGTETGHGRSIVKGYIYDVEGEGGGEDLGWGCC